MMLREIDGVKNSERIRNHLRSSFTAGDTNNDAQFWYARHEFLHGDSRKAAFVFGQPKAMPVSHSSRTQGRGYVLDATGTPGWFEGRVKTASDTYCFVSCVEFGHNVYIHFSQFSG